MTDTSVVIWHNPRCGTSRKVLQLIRQAGIEPTVVEYLKTSPDRDTLEPVIADAGIGVHGLIRSKEPAFKALGLDKPGIGEAELVDAMLAHPVLIDRPVVITPRGTRLCRPPETVVDLLA